MANIKTHQIDPKVLDVLARATTDGNALKLVGQLERPLYVATNKVLEALGGKWDRKSQAHIFDGDAADMVENAVLTGQYIRGKEDFGAFMTPQPLADFVTAVADVRPGMDILEPSAGTGNIVQSIRNAGAKCATVEIQPNFCDALKLRFPGHSVANLNFLHLMPGPSRYHRVVMNPPFAKRADIHHINHAAKFVRPGGRLVAIASASVKFRTDAMAHAFRSMVEKARGTIEDLPAGSFKESGTMVNTVMVTMNF